MTKNGQAKFKVRFNLENGYYRIHITHPAFKGRIRKRLGDKTSEDAEENAMSIRYELNREFKSRDFTKQEIEDYVEKYISLNVKCNGSFFDYVDDYLAYKGKSINKLTERKIQDSTLKSISTALQYYKDYFDDKKISPQPSQITESNLNDFYAHLNEKSHNTRVKIHHKVKGFLKYLIIDKNITIDERYRKSVFNEKYDNQNPDDGDRALTVPQVQKLISLRNRLLTGEQVIEHKPMNLKIPLEMQEFNQLRKEKNLITSLDCFLFMISTGQYRADIMNSILHFSGNGKNTHVRYRRSKNNSLCKTIPIVNDGIFIGKEIIEQYGIKDGSNFPLNLSLRHFDKHLERISEMAGIDFKITTKMARKTFASELYFNRRLPIHYLQILLGHQNPRDTAHYLRIADDDIADEILRRLELKK